MKIESLKIGDLVAKMPIVQGGMGIGVSLSGLASSVANEGGIGVISVAQVGYLEEDFETNHKEANERALRKEIRRAREKSANGIIGVNIMVAAKEYVDLVRVAVEEKIDLIISGAGLPTNLPELVQGTKVKIAPIVSSLKAMVTLMMMWNKRYDKDPDAVIIEGSKAGGHLGFAREELDQHTEMDVLDILKQVLDYLKSINKNIPVIVGGGIFSGRDVAECLKMGASGVQMATRFVTTEECDVHKNFKEAYINAKEEDIVIMQSPVGMPGRALNNTFLKKLKEGTLERVQKCHACIHKCNPATTPFCITRALINSAKGDVDNGLIFIGSNGYLNHKIETVKEIFDTIRCEVEAYV